MPKLIFYKIVETDNYGEDYPDEKFINLPSTTKEKAESIAKVINDNLCYSRFWKVVDTEYVLQPGFEP